MVATQTFEHLTYSYSNFLFNQIFCFVPTSVYFLCFLDSHSTNLISVFTYSWLDLLNLVKKFRYFPTFLPVLSILPLSASSSLVDSVGLQKIFASLAFLGCYPSVWTFDLFLIKTFALFLIILNSSSFVPNFPFNQVFTLSLLVFIFCFFILFSQT